MMLVIYGPTATGKTALATKLAKKYNGEIISADSRQVYRGLDIGTGKVSFDSDVKKHNNYWIVDGVKIHGFDLVAPEGKFSAADFYKFARKTSKLLTKGKKLPVLVGGTGFYIKSYLEGIGTLGIARDEKLRKKLEGVTTPDLFKKLQKINPGRAVSMNDSDRNNPRRLIRAIEVAYSNKASEGKSGLQDGNKIDYLAIGLTASNSFLYQKIDKWLDTRLKNGLIEEVENLISNNVNPDWLEKLGLEYRWITKYVQGEITKEVAQERLTGDIHDFARRQKNWFSKIPNINMFDISEPNWQDELGNKVSLWYNRNESNGN